MSSSGQYIKHNNSLLEVLADYISNQVSIRDYSLVEQSDMLVIYRPLFNGNASGGVREEFSYFKKLKTDHKKHSLSFIYCPKEDVRLFYSRQFEKIIDLELENQNLRGDPENSKSLKLSEKHSAEIADAMESGLPLIDWFDKILDENNIKIIVKNTITPLSKNQVRKYKKALLSRYKNKCKVYQLYKDNATHFEEESVTINEFIESINEYMSNNKT